MKDVKEILNELDLENVTGGLALGLADEAENVPLGLAAIRPLADKLKAENYSLALASEALAKLPLADKFGLAKLALADELASGSLAEDDELALAKGLADLLARVW